MKKIVDKINKKIKNTESNETHIVTILDMSGSMGEIANEVIGSFNKFIDDQKTNEDNAIVSLVLFDNIIEKPFTKIDLNDMPKIDEKIYWPRGLTSLYDAIGQTIARFKEDENVILLIQTDGMDNTSKEYTQQSVKNLIKKMTEKGWDINFLGADIDVKVEGMGMGMSTGKSVAFSKSATGVSEAFASMNSSTVSYRNEVSIKGK